MFKSEGTALVGAVFARSTAWIERVGTTLAGAEHADADTKLRRFLRQWTAKEALVKANGRGLKAGSTRQFSICVPLTPGRDLTPMFDYLSINRVLWCMRRRCIW